MRKQSQSPRRDKFTPAGVVEVAELTIEPPFITMRRQVERGIKGKKGEGVRYERKAQLYLSETCGGGYIAGPWLRFHSRNDPGWRYCQPDGILVDLQAGRITIIEIKLKHTASAWWQVRELYEPVLEQLFNAGNRNKPLWRFAACEVVKWYDPHTQFPERLLPTRLVADIPVGSFGLHIWSGKRRRFRQS